MAFSDEIARATDALREFTDELAAAGRASRSGGGGGPGGGGGGGGGGFGGLPGIGRLGGRGLAGLAGLGAAAGVAGLAVGAANALDPAVGLAVQSGSLQGFTSGINRSLLGAVSSIPLIGALSGADRTQRVAEASIAQAGSPLEDLARYGVEVSDELIDSQLEVARTQQKRIDTVRGRVTAAGFSAEGIASAGEGTGVGAVVSVLNQILDAIKSFGGGAR